ncbi:MAG: hypothetical protein WAM97_05710 [Acidimicrobiales bacterium]
MATAGRRGVVTVPGSRATAPKTPLRRPALILAADHRGRGVITIEAYSSYLGACRAALVHCDGILATAQPLAHLTRMMTPFQRSYLSINRTGLAGTVFELDDRLVATVARAVADGCTGIKHMTRIDKSDPVTAEALELLGRVLEECRLAGVEAMIESLTWRDGKVARDTDSIVYAAVIAHDLGAPVLKVPVPLAEPGSERIEAVARIVSSVGVPVLFLGGPKRAETASGEDDVSALRAELIDEVSDVMTGGAAGLAIGRALILDPDPGEITSQVAKIVHGG